MAQKARKHSCNYWVFFRSSAVSCGPTFAIRTTTLSEASADDDRHVAESVVLGITAGVLTSFLVVEAFDLVCGQVGSNPCDLPKLSLAAGASVIFVPLGLLVALQID